MSFNRASANSSASGATVGFNKAFSKRRYGLNIRYSSHRTLPLIQDIMILHNEDYNIVKVISFPPSLKALWRGHRSRRLNDNPKVVKLRHRLRKVSADVREEDKLCNKTSSALDYLLRYKHFSYILEALKNLGKGFVISQNHAHKICLYEINVFY